MGKDLFMVGGVEVEGVGEGVEGVELGVGEGNFGVRMVGVVGN